MMDSVFGRPPVGPRPPGTGRALVRYVAPAAEGAGRFFSAGMALTTGLLWPSQMADATLSGEQRLADRQRYWDARFQAVRAARQTDVRLMDYQIPQRYDLDEMRQALSRNLASGEFGPPLDAPEVDEETLLERLMGFGQGLLAERLGVGLELPEYEEAEGPTPGEYDFEKAATDAQRQGEAVEDVNDLEVATPAKRGLLGRINQTSLNKALLYGGLVGVAAGLRKRSSTPAAAAPLTRSEGPGVQFQPYTGTAPPSSRAGCNCKPSKRGPRRKCLERGSVAWKSGRFKGRSAGMKCIRWAN
jgi:hypothetical protein